MDQLRRATIGLHLIAVDAVQEGPGRISAVRVLIRQRRAIVFGIPAFAGNHASMTADTGIKINNKTELAVSVRGQLGHDWSAQAGASCEKSALLIEEPPTLARQ